MYTVYTYKRMVLAKSTHMLSDALLASCLRCIPARSLNSMITILPTLELSSKQ
jgi:hypothetical protein